MSDVTQADLERVRGEAGKALGKHEVSCERRYGEINATLARLEANMARNLKLLYVLLAGMLAVAARSFWPALFGGGP